MGVLDGKVAIITGAAQGIGKAIAERFAVEGARVALLDADHVAAQAMAETIGPPAIASAADVGDEVSVTTAVERVATQLGKVDILVNNAAATSKRAQITELSLEDWETAIRVNLTGVFLVCRAVLPLMVRNGGGVIINVASQLGSVAIPQSAAYCSSKGGVLQLTRALALDHAADGVRVNSLSPGAVMTPRLTELYGTSQKAEEALSPKHPIGRIGQPEDIAGAAVFLASSDSSFMTGANLVVDGGYTAQ